MSGKVSGQQENENAFVAGWTAASARQLKALVKEFGSQDQVAKRAQISRQSLSEILRFDPAAELGSRPRYRSLQAICDVIGADPQAVIDAGAGDDDADEEEDGDAVVIVRRYRAQASAGPGLVPLPDGADEGMPFPRRFLRQLGISANQAAIVEARGDSMQPTILNGGLLLLGRTEEIVDAGVYVFGREGEVSVKRLHPLDRGEDGKPQTLAIVSDNPAYAPETLTGEEINAIRPIGRVRFVMTEL